MNFISSLLVSDANSRLSAKEALSHPWLSDKENITYFDGLKFAEFSEFQHLKSTISMLFKDRYCNIKPIHFEQLKNIFIEMDKNGHRNGKISYSQFMDGLKKIKELEFNHDDDIYQICVLNGSAPNAMIGAELIDFNAMLQELLYDYLVVTDARLYQVCSDLDENGDGKILTEQLKIEIIKMDPYGYADFASQAIDNAGCDENGYIVWDTKQ